MSKILNQLRGHLREDFKFNYYIIIFTFLVVSLIYNYQSHFYKTVLSSQTGYQRFLYYFIFYALPYLFATATYLICTKHAKVFLKKEFWIKSILIIFILTINQSFLSLFPSINQSLNNEVKLLASKILKNLISLVFTLVPLLLYYYFNERKEKHLYGLQIKHFDFKPYVMMLMLMLPLIIMASFTKGFLEQYPMYKNSIAYIYLGVPEWLTVVGYEIVYGLNFISVEFLFRGFMVIGMISLLGRGAILPMAVVYCFLHFGKPAGEAISSIFGGYLLGVVAYETRSIWGGVIVHIGIAWGMETAAYIQKLFY